MKASAQIDNVIFQGFASNWMMSRQRNVGRVELPKEIGASILARLRAEPTFTPDLEIPNLFKRPGYRNGQFDKSTEILKFIDVPGLAGFLKRLPQHERGPFEYTIAILEDSDNWTRSDPDDLIIALHDGAVYLLATDFMDFEALEPVSPNVPISTDTEIYLLPSLSVLDSPLFHITVTSLLWIIVTVAFHLTQGARGSVAMGREGYSGRPVEFQ